MSADGVFAAVNGVSITLGEARSLALRLGQRNDEDEPAAAQVSVKLDALAQEGGETTVGGAEARALAAALDAWLDETNEDVLGERLLRLRQRLRDERG